MCIFSQDYNWESVLFVEKWEMETEPVCAHEEKLAVDEAHGAQRNKYGSQFAKIRLLTANKKEDL